MSNENVNHNHKNKDPLGREDPCKCRTWPEIWNDYLESIKTNTNSEKNAEGS